MQLLYCLVLLYINRENSLLPKCCYATSDMVVPRRFPSKPFLGYLTKKTSEMSQVIRLCWIFSFVRIAAGIKDLLQTKDKKQMLSLIEVHKLSRIFYIFMT